MTLRLAHDADRLVINGLRCLDRIRYPLATTALAYWDRTSPMHPNWAIVHLDNIYGMRATDVTEADEGDDWISADCEDEARSAPVEEGGAGMVSAFGDEGIDPCVAYSAYHRVNPPRYWHGVKYLL